MSFYYSVKTSFSSGHFYKNPEWDDQQNLAAFGKCFTPHGHGHDYHAEVQFKIEASREPQGEYPQDSLLNSLENLVKEICQKLDHEHLNFRIPFFKKENPTTENIGRFIGLEINKRFLDQNLKEEILKHSVKISSLQVFEGNLLYSKWNMNV
jgi:6-pyruvoyltetrahydropterin/6-carboxytetrahydropterin synthase